MQSLVIGHFARATHINVKTLRHYHSIGLLEPAIVDPKTGYRRYALEQISTERYSPPRISRHETISLLAI